jgi:hypothetical protein
MRVLYPASPLEPRRADDFYDLERAAVRTAGLTSSLFSFDALEAGEALRFKPNLEPGELVVYRGWMLRADTYARLVTAVEGAGARMLVSSAQYTLTHHLPEWYAPLEALTPRTRFFADASSAARVLETEPGPFFVKDWVKSLSTGRSSVARSAEEIGLIVAELERTRGALEGGVCVRDFETFVPNTERRFFVARGQAFAPDGDVPELVRVAAARIASPFFTVDTATREDGVTRIVELGDGGVSDLKHWSLEAFVKVLEHLASG